ncbi:TBC1 domain family member 10B [Protopterus annectens]|uniref:TBC1 domain family member 10B n=1 Tax=Protopterus annectens TaxID=7888 RepID=UPI001CFB717A|nr:TBC1 domain family member 10B [Protopterus annectens]
MKGVKIVFRVGLVLLRSTLGAREKLRDCQGMYETMEKLRNIPVQYMQEDYLAQEVINLPVTEALIERESGIQRKKWEESRGELQHKPSRRLYGCRAVNEEKHRMNPPLSSSASFLSITSLKRFKDDKKDKSRMLRDQKIFIPVPLVASIEEHPLNYSPVNPSTNSVTKPTKEERREDVEPGRHEQKKDRAEKDVSIPSASVSKTSHEPPELTVQVVSEGLRPSLPSPTANITPLGEPKKNKDDKKKEKELEKQRAREMKEREKQFKLEKEKEQKEREKQLKLEKEKDRKIQKEKNKEETKLKKEKRSKQKDQPETTESSKDKPSQKGEAKADGVNGTKGCAEKVPATTLAQKSTDAQNVNSPSSNLSSAGELQATFL